MVPDIRKEMDDYSEDDWEEDSDDKSNTHAIPNDTTFERSKNHRDQTSEFSKSHRGEDDRDAAGALRVGEEIFVDVKNLKQQEVSRDRKWSTPKNRSGIIKSRATTFDDMPPPLPKSEEITAVDIAAQRLPFANIPTGSSQSEHNYAKNQKFHQAIPHATTLEQEQAPLLPRKGPLSKIYHGAKRNTNLFAHYITIAGHTKCASFHKALATATRVPGVHVNSIVKSQQVAIGFFCACNNQADMR